MALGSRRGARGGGYAGGGSIAGIGGAGPVPAPTFQTTEDVAAARAAWDAVRGVLEGADIEDVSEDLTHGWAVLDVKAPDTGRACSVGITLVDPVSSQLPMQPPVEQLVQFKAGGGSSETAGLGRVISVKPRAGHGLTLSVAPRRQRRASVDMAPASCSAAAQHEDVTRPSVGPGGQDNATAARVAGVEHPPSTGGERDIPTGAPDAAPPPEYTGTTVSVTFEPLLARDVPYPVALTVLPTRPCPRPLRGVGVVYYPSHRGGAWAALHGMCLPKPITRATCDLVDEERAAAEAAEAAGRWRCTIA